MENEELKAVRYRIGNSLFKMGRQSGKTQLAKDLKYLIEQAERVRELENFKKKAEELYKYTHINAKKSIEEKENLEQENEHYRKALEKIQGKYVDTHCFDFIPIDIALEINQIVNEALGVTK